MMNLLVAIPDTLAVRLSQNGADLERQALEALVLENVRAGRITSAEVREILGFTVLNQVDGFLKAHGVYEPHTVEDIDRDVEALGHLSL